MKRPYLLLISVLVLTGVSSCSVSKNSTTTDDVYYSPNTPVKITSTGSTENSDYYSTPNDNYVKMRVQNPDKWSYFDDYNYDYYGYSPYGYGSGVSLSVGFGVGYYNPYFGGFGYYSPMSYYNCYYAWNSFYNPYYGAVIVVNGKNPAAPSYTRTSTFNPSSYQGNYYNTRPVTHGTSISHFQPSSNTSPNNNMYRPTNSHPTYVSPMRSAPSNFSSGGGSGGGGGMRGGGGSRPGR